MINSLDEIYSKLKKYDEIKNYKLLMYDKKLVLMFSDTHKIECNKQIVIYENNKVIFKENKNYTEIYMYLLNLIKTNKFYVPKTSKIKGLLDSGIIILAALMLSNASRMGLKEGIIFCVIYASMVLFGALTIKLIINIYYSSKMKKVDKNDIKCIKKYIKIPLSKETYKNKIELEFYNMKEICKSFLKYPNELNMNLKFNLDEEIKKEILKYANEQVTELKKECKLYLTVQKIVYKYYDEHGTKKTYENNSTDF